MSNEYPHDLVADEPAADPRPPRPARLNRKMVIAAVFCLVAVGAIAMERGFRGPSLQVGEAENDPEGPNLLHSQVLEGTAAYDYAALTKKAEPPQPSFEQQIEETKPALPRAEPTWQVQPAGLTVQPDPTAGVRQQVVIQQKVAVDADAMNRRKHLAQELEAARKSGLFPSGRTQTAGSVQSASVPQNGVSDGLSGASGDTQERIPEGTLQNLQGNKVAFRNSAGLSGPYVNKPYLRPISPYEVQAGTVIPGALVTGLNSDLPGEVIGRVTAHVYDSPSGKHLLVPQGTSVIGRYNSYVAYGQSRAQIVWHRLVMPDGRSIELETMTGADLGGYSGLEDEVDRHWGQIFAGILLSTAISVVSNIATDDSSDGGIQDELGSAVAQESAQVGSQIVRRTFDVQPTIKVRPGWPFNIIVHKDLVLEPYIL